MRERLHADLRTRLVAFEYECKFVYECECCVYCVSYEWCVLSEY